MNCRKFRMLFLEHKESGAGGILPGEMILHKHSCGACQVFCQHLEAQYASLQEEKNTLSNPFLAQKIIHRMKAEKSMREVAIPAFRKLLLYPAVVCLGLFTAFLLNYLMPGEADQADELTAGTTTQAVYNEDDSGENAVLTLNEEK